MKKYIIAFSLVIAFGIATILMRARSQTSFPPSWATSPLAQMASVDSTVDLELTHNEWTPITNATKDFFIDKKYLGLPVDGDSMIVEWEGSYMVNLVCGLEGLVTNSEYSIGLLVNGAHEGALSHAKLESAGDVTNSTFVGIFGFNAGDVLKVGIISTANDDNVIVINAQAVVKYVGAIEKTVFP